MLHKIFELQIEDTRFELDLLPSVLKRIAWMLTLRDYLYCFMIQKSTYIITVLSLTWIQEAFKVFMVNFADFLKYIKWYVKTK